MLSLLLTWQVSVPLSFLVALFLASLLAEYRGLLTLRGLSAAGLAEKVRTRLARQSNPAPVEPTSLEADFFDYLSEYVLGFDGTKPILTRSARALVDDWIDAREEGSIPSLLGSSFTGIALIFTFALIAWVLFDDVHTAIMRSADGSAGATAPLADAVAKMGTKFVISCVGILLAIVHMFTNRWFRRATRRQGRRIARALESVVVERASLEVRRSGEVVVSLGLLHDAIHHEEAALGAKLERLSHIEVSVDNLGAQVSENLGMLMKETLAEEVKLLLADMRSIAEGIEERLARTLEGNLQTLADGLGRSLDALRSSFESQPASQMEKLLSTFQNAVTGGFSSETKNMSGLLESFQTTLPKLSLSIETMTGQMQTVLEQMKEQQFHSEHLMSSIAASTSESVARLGSDFTKQGTDAMAHVLEEVNSRVERIVRGLDAAATHNAGSSSTIRADMEAASRKVGKLTASLSTSLGQVSQIIAQVDAVMTTSSRSVLALAEGSTSLRTAADGVRTTIAKSDETRGKMEALLGQQVELASKLSQALSEMQKVYPNLLREVGAAMQTSSTALSDSWTKLSQQLQQVTARYGTEVGERVEGLSTAVEILVKEIKNLPPAQMRR